MLSANLKGLSQLTARLAKMAQTPGLGESVAQSAQQLRGAAAQEAPGLADALSIERSGEHIYALKADTPLARRLEFGTLAAPARPWAAPAIAMSRPAIRASLARWLKSALK